MLDFIQNGGTALASNPLTVLINIALSFGLTVLIALVYKKTHSGLSYSRSFVFTLILMSILISVVMMVIGNSIAAAFTLLGAFTIIRFRTAIKETRDIAFVFWALVTGMAVGTGSYMLAIVATASIIAIVLILSKINFGSIKNYDHILVFLVDTSVTAGDIYKSLFDKYLKFSNLLNINTREEGKKLDFTFSVRFMNDDVSAFVTELKNLNGISGVSLMVAKDDIEY
ncbi:MAG: DUF4956 domain-containing protein [Elusimicrobia bacterium]|nr:DUF4956 domain-containing protein [Elusimicrobiota bacterium]